MIVVIVVMITVAIVAVVVGGRAVAPTIPSSVSATAISSTVPTAVATWVVAATVTVVSSSPRRIGIPVPVRHATGHKDRQDHGGGKCRKGDAKIHSGIGNELDGLLPIAFKTMEK